ncbi:hypothetical protein PHISCL_04777 [Aspergillus sclerotialis]|uniref:Uncharacterized protein n=1 Tax=Aspergillus sclerotialis TaxID=2070753 RepID=A0A3A3A0N7_9EURO|nr:hypothetical protein PHISCL_04777 [Aspergillus sclerotialis]
MNRFTSIFLALTAISNIASSLTWVLEWRNGNPDNATIEKGSEPRSCTAINHTEGLQFSWDAHGGPWCLDLYGDVGCTNGIGRACKPYPWEKNASQDILAFDVESSSPSSTSIQSLTTSTRTSSSTASAETTTDASGGGGGSSLSGGGIAGVVVGVVVGVGIIAGLAFFLGMRRRKQKKSAIVAEQNIPPGSSGHTKSPSMDKPVAWAQSPNQEEQPHRLAPGSRVVELPGHDMTPELSDHNRVVELDTPHTDMKPPFPH